jgi:N-acetyl-anhydromuramyl-L-alanine amidase AmpD
MLATFTRRIAGKVATRGLVVALGVGYSEAPFIDLRGKLPTTGEYPARDMDRVDAIVVHHSATRGQTIRSIAEFHTATRGWPSIAYHFAVGWDGKVYQLNDVERRTNHAQGFNSRSIGVCLIGDYEAHPVPPETVHSLSHLIEALSEQYGPLRIVLHSETKQTKCPGYWGREAVERIR